MRLHESSTRRCMLALCATGAALALSAAAAGALDWEPFEADSTVEIVTRDEDGSPRETTVWIVVLDDSGFIRTNDSRWLANIRRDAAVQLRSRGALYPFQAQITDDAALYDRVELAFKAKYGLMQKLMSAFRTSRPTVLRLSPRSEP